MARTEQLLSAQRICLGRQEATKDPNGEANVPPVNDQPGKFMSYEVMLEELTENIIKTSSAKEALEVLLKTDMAVSVAAQHALVPA